MGNGQWAIGNREGMKTRQQPRAVCSGLLCLGRLVLVEGGRWERVKGVQLAVTASSR